MRPADAAALLIARWPAPSIQRRPQWAREQEVLRCPVGFRAWLRRSRGSRLRGRNRGVCRHRAPQARLAGGQPPAARHRSGASAARARADQPAGAHGDWKRGATSWRAATDEDIAAALAQLPGKQSRRGDRPSHCGAGGLIGGPDPLRGRGQPLHQGLERDQRNQRRQERLGGPRGVFEERNQPAQQRRLAAD